MASAAERSAAPLLAATALTPRCNVSRSPVPDATIRASGPTVIPVMRSCGPSWSMIAFTWRFATSRRDGVTSVACIDAEASISTMLWRARAAPAGRAGCTAAATRTAAASNWRKSSQLGRSRCQGTLACRSRIWLGQRCSAGTIRVGRRILRKYRATMAGIVNARNAAAGARKLMTRAPFHTGARSCEQSETSQRDLHHLVDGFRGRQAGEAKAAAMRDALDLVGALGQRAKVAALG